MNELTQKQAYVAGLREVADWYESHPDAPLLDLGSTTVRLDSYAFQAKPEQVKAIGAGEKDFTGGDNFRYIVELPHATLRFITSRDKVCVPKVVGYREIPEQHVQAHVVPAQRKEIVEWECRESLLSSEVSA